MSIARKIILTGIVMAVFWLVVITNFNGSANFAMANSNPGTNISFASSTYWAWNDVLGWFNFHDTHNIIVDQYGLAGYASSSVGDISLDCATTRAGNICGASNYRALNDGNGNLSGWGWNDVAGWISFCGGASSTDCPGTLSNYQTIINPNNGNFSGWAWNDAVGWISFNCSNVPGSCATSQYSVITTWIATSTSGYFESTTYDTGISGGAQLNSFFWNGSQPIETWVDFQFAGSNSSGGPWNYAGPSGAGSFYTAGPGVPSLVDYGLYNNYRYFRYKAVLHSDPSERYTPRIDDLVMNWSP